MPVCGRIIQVQMALSTGLLRTSRFIPRNPTMCAPLRLVCLSFVALSIVFLPNMAITGTTRATTSSSSPLYDVEPGEAHASIRENQIILDNNMFAARWSISQSAVSKAELIVHAVAPEPEKSIALSQNIFVLRFKDGTILLSAD